MLIRAFSQSRIVYDMHYSPFKIVNYSSKVKLKNATCYVCLPFVLIVVYLKKFHFSMTGLPVLSSIVSIVYCVLVTKSCTHTMDMVARDQAFLTTPGPQNRPCKTFRLHEVDLCMLVFLWQFRNAANNTCS